MSATPKAIPTEYKGTKFKSRLEAQCAFLFDQIGWEWTYEPKSFMLPNGVSYTPDFYLNDTGTFWECRGYVSEKGEKQIIGFVDLIRAEEATTDDGCDVHALVLVRGDGESAIYTRRERSRSVAIIYCRECGWYLAPTASDRVYGSSPLQLFCPCCIAPMDPSRRLDSRIVERCLIVTAREGRILVNGVPPSDCPVMFQVRRDGDD